MGKQLYPQKSGLMKQGGNKAKSRGPPGTLNTKAILLVSKRNESLQTVWGQNRHLLQPSLSGKLLQTL